MSTTVECLNATYDLANLPWPTLLDLVQACPDACRRWDGLGDTDLAGIGVVVSYIIHLVIAIPFALVLITEDLVLPSLKRTAAPTPLRHLLARHHEVALWTSLVFTLSISLGAAVQALTNAITGPTQGFEAMQSVNVSYASLLLICASRLDRLPGRPRLFGVALLATSVLAVVPFGVISTQQTGEGILRACLTVVVASGSGEPRSAGIIEPFSGLEKAVNWLNFGLAVALLGCWWVVLRFEKRWRATRSRLLARVVLILLLSGLAGYFIALAIQSLNSLMLVRGVMDQLWNGQTNVNKWGIGQIGAPFAWAPLIMDFCYDGLGTLSSYLLGSRADVRGPNTVAEDLEDVEMQHMCEEGALVTAVEELPSSKSR